MLDIDTLPKDVSARMPDLSVPNLAALSYILRRRSFWPAGFSWDFGYYESCAGGLALLLWGNGKPDKWDPGHLGLLFKISYDDAAFLFLGAWVPMKTYTTGHLWWKRGWIKQDFSVVTPDMVADQIDHYLATSWGGFAGG